MDNLTKVREVKELAWVREPDCAPFPLSRSKGAKANGRRFENNLAEVLPSRWKHGVWLKFWDKNGLGYAQPDFFLLESNRIIILEAKYTWVNTAEKQINKLYRPILEFFYGLPTFGVIVVKRLTPEVPKGSVFGDLNSAINSCCEVLPTWQWVGDASSANYGEKS